MSDVQMLAEPILPSYDILARAGDLTAQAALHIRAFSKPYIQRRAARETINELSRLMSYASEKYIPRAGLLLPIARAGVAMLASYEDTYGYPRVAFAVARKDKVRRTVELSLSASIDETVSPVILLDTVAATGDTLIEVGAELRSRGIGNVSAAVAFASPEALDSIKAANLFRHIQVGVVGDGVENGWILPRIHGDAGEKLFGRVV